MTWEEFWVWYRNTTKEIQEDVLRQINFKEFLQSLTPKYQKEILAHAPQSIKESVDTVFDISKELLQLLDRNGILLK